MVKSNVISAGLRATAIALGLASGLAVSTPSAQAQQSKPTETKAAPQVTGEELEMMLQEWDTPLVVDAYATW